MLPEHFVEQRFSEQITAQILITFYPVTDGQIVPDLAQGLNESFC